MNNYMEMSNSEKNTHIKTMCMITGNAQIKGKKTMNGKQIGLTNNQLINTDIISHGFKYESRSFTRNGITYRKTFKIKVENE